MALIGSRAWTQPVEPCSWLDSSMIEHATHLKGLAGFNSLMHVEPAVHKSSKS